MKKAFLITTLLLLGYTQAAESDGIVSARDVFAKYTTDSGMYVETRVSSNTTFNPFDGLPGNGKGTLTFYVVIDGERVVKKTKKVTSADHAFTCLQQYPNC